MIWKGGNTAGVIVTSGTYKWTLRATDAAGNVRTSAAQPTNFIHLARRTASYTFNGNQLYEAVATSAGCAFYSPQASRYTNGVVLSNRCSGFVREQASFRVNLPAAMFYDDATIQANGVSTTGSSNVFASVGDGVGWYVGPSVAAGSGNAWLNLGTQTITPIVSSNGLFHFGIGVDTGLGSPAGFDLNSVAVSVRYRARSDRAACGSGETGQLLTSTENVNDLPGSPGANGRSYAKATSPVPSLTPSNVSTCSPGAPTPPPAGAW